MPTFLDEVGGGLLGMEEALAVQAAEGREEEKNIKKRI